MFDMPKVNVYKSNLSGGSFEYEGTPKECIRTGSYVIAPSAPFSEEPISNLAFHSGVVMGTIEHIKANPEHMKWLADRGVNLLTLQDTYNNLMVVAEAFYKDK